MYNMENGKTKVSINCETKALLQVKRVLLEKNIKLTTFLESIIVMASVKPELITIITQEA